MGNETGRPVLCRDNVRKLADRLQIDTKKAYSMILLTSILTDLSPADAEIVDIIIKDCEPGVGNRVAET